jgi:indolepyruvate ferredoxin oxidoreductase
MLGVAAQTGAIPVSPSSISEAIELHGVSVDMNLAAFSLGRNWVTDPSNPQYLLTKEEGFSDSSPLPSDLESVVEDLGRLTGLGSMLRLFANDLIGFQNTKSASLFLDLVQKIALAEQSVMPGSNRLTEAAARGLHKLTAYKDEYEVARLLLRPEGKAVAHQVGNEDSSISWHLHPPVLSGMGVTKKWKLPASLGKPLMLLLSKGKVLRGTRFDLFGYTDVRRLERELVSEYQKTLHLIVENLSQNNFEECVAISKLALDVRGFEALKLERGKACLDALSKVERLIS